MINSTYAQQNTRRKAYCGRRYRLPWRRNIGELPRRMAVSAAIAAIGCTPLAATRENIYRRLDEMKIKPGA